MNTKKIIKFLAACTVCTVLAVCGLAIHNVYAVNYAVQNLLAPANWSTTALKNIAYVGYVLPGGETYTNGQTNMTYYIYGNNYPQFVSQSQVLYAFSTNQIGISSSGTIGGTGYTNITAWGTNINLLNPYAYALTGTNTYFMVYTNGFSNTASGNQLPGFCQGVNAVISADANGNYNGNQGFTFAADSDSLDIGTLTINLAKSYDGLTYNPSNLYAISLTLNSLTNSITNVSFAPTTITSGLTSPYTNNLVTNALSGVSAWANGARTVEVYSVVSPTNGGSGTNIFLYVGELSGFGP